MPWFPDFVSAVELARRQTRAAGQADPVGAVLRRAEQRRPARAGDGVARRGGGPRPPRRRGPRPPAAAASSSAGTRPGWPSATPGSRRWPPTCVGGRAVVELLAHLADDGRELAWPVAVVAESPDDRSVVFRTYCSQWPVDGRRHLRPPILEPGAAQPGDVVGRYHAALDAGDAEAIVSTFAPDGYFREPIGPTLTHRGTDELRSFFTRCFSAGGGIGLQHCAVTDDGVRCAAGVQLRPLGQPRPAAPGRDRRLRTRPGRAAGRGPRLRRHRSTRSRRKSQMSAASSPKKTSPLAVAGPANPGPRTRPCPA